MLKPLVDLTAADSRFENIVRLDPATGQIFPMTIGDHYAMIEEISLSDTVPQDIRTAFDRARNAFLYAWFSYELTTLAQAQAYAALEMALRERVHRHDPTFNRRGLSTYFQAARRFGLFGGMKLPDGQDAGPDLDHWETSLPAIRNYLAHGSSYVNLPGAASSAIRHCSWLIDHLYR